MGTPSIERRRKRLGYVFLLPSFVILGAFLFYPVVNSVVMSLTDWTGFGNGFAWVGFDNYVRIFTDMPAFWASLLVNLKFALISTTVQTILGFLLAFVVYQLTKRWQKFYQVALYVPVILPAAGVAVMWVFIYDPNFGLLNQLLHVLGLDSLARGWLGEPSTALGSVIVTNTWRYVGFTMILYYIAMLDIPKEVLESSTIDGAGKLKQMRYFFLPLTWGTTEINFMLSLIGGMKSFDLFYLMTGGGPGTSTQVVGMLIYREAFQNFRFSSALTMSVILFLVILIITVISRTFLKPKEL
jgi:raffinose/stachyose/melibiose transport system permease protein